MKRLEHAAFLIIAGLLLGLLALFPLLTLDAVSKLVSRSGGLDAGDFMLVLYLELSRAFTTIVAVLAIVFLMVRSSKRADGRALTLFLIFIALTYEKIFGGTGYPGPLQERLTIWLLEAGVPRAGLHWLFGPVPWSLWLALAAIMRFSVVFPRPPLSAALIDASGAHDRQGMLRGAGVAGMDIGAALRAICKRGLAMGAFRPLALWSLAIVLIVMTTMMSRTARLILFATAATTVTALVITNLRASYNVVAPEEKTRVRWLLLGFLAAAALFVIASVPLLFFNDALATVPALVLLMIAPAVIVVCMALAVLYDGPVDASQLLEGLPGWAAIALGMVLVFAVATTLFGSAAQAAGLSRTIAVASAVVLTALVYRPLQRVTERSVNRVLERPGR